MKQEAPPGTAALLAAAGFVGDFDLQRLQGGANNKVFRVDTPNSSILLKVYFQHPEDPRDRLGAEFSFSNFAWQNGLRCLPKPIGCDRKNRLGLYEFVQGRPLSPQEVNKGAVRKALDFFCELNRHKWSPTGQALPEGSEACFSIADHERCVERRLQRLNRLEISTEVDLQAVDFIRNDLSEAWKRVTSTVCRRTKELCLAFDAGIPIQDRCLSPSDFGYHNAILGNDGVLRFIDFEYAGWDDPAKTVCDFFCQPALPVPLDYYTMFVEAVVKELSEPEKHRERFALLFPVYQIKWCCILLNGFLPVGSQRRNFAGNMLDQEERKAEQLQKTRQALQRLVSFDLFRQG